MTVISAAQWVSRDDHRSHRMPSAFLPERFRELRSQAGLSQAELAYKIGSDARHVSRCENGRVGRSFEALVHIAETFNTSVDYLVTPGVTRRLLCVPGNALDAGLADLGQLTDDERATILAVIATKAKLRIITGMAS